MAMCPLGHDGVKTGDSKRGHIKMQHGWDVLVWRGATIWWRRGVTHTGIDQKKKPHDFPSS